MEANCVQNCVQNDYSATTPRLFATLDAPVAERSAEGLLFLRGMAAVLLRGPAVVQLAAPFRVERLPDHEANYWEDLRFPTAQFWLPFTGRTSK